MNKFFLNLISLGLTLVASPALAKIAGPTSEIGDLPRDESFIPIIVTVILWAMVYAFALSVLIIIIAGIMYTTSASNTELMERAKKTLQYAITGLVISLVGYFIVLGISGILFGDIVGGVFGIFR